MICGLLRNFLLQFSGKIGDFLKYLCNWRELKDLARTGQTLLGFEAEVILIWLQEPAFQ
jgi:hypothetical protein